MSFTKIIEQTQQPAEGHFFPETAEQRRQQEREQNLKKIAEVTLGWNDLVEDEISILSFLNTSVANLKNLSLLLGIKKAGKSSLLSLILGDRTGIAQRSLPSNKSHILFCDLEQSGKYLRKLQDRVYNLSGDKPATMTFLKLRGKSKKERLELIKLGISLDPEIGLVIIDNIKDLCHDFNDLNEADKVATMLVHWAQDFNIHIMCVLHLNKGNGLSRGHLGSELENKAETVIKVRRDEQNNCVIVEPEATRDKPFEKFSFYYDEAGLPIVQRMDSIGTKVTKGSKEPFAHSELVHLNILDDVFKISKEYGYEQLWKAIKNSANRYSLNLGDNTAKDWLSYYKQEGLVSYNDKRKYVRGLTSLN